MGNGSKYVYVDVCSKSAHVQEGGGMGPCYLLQLHVGVGM